MFLEGQLLYFTPSYFKNVNVPKNKFFIILKVIGNDTILGSLPTKVNNAPSLIGIDHGCINHNDRLFNCYLFKQGKIICDTGFSFELDTYLYGNQIDDYNVDDITANSTIKEGVDYFVKGIFVKEEFYAIKECLANSHAVKSRIKRLLAG